MYFIFSVRFRFGFGVYVKWPLAISDCNLCIMLSKDPDNEA